jgi:hypothetical protein
MSETMGTIHKRDRPYIGVHSPGFICPSICDHYQMSPHLSAQSLLYNVFPKTSIYQIFLFYFMYLLMFDTIIF